MIYFLLSPYNSINQDQRLIMKDRATLMALHFWQKGTVISPIHNSWDFQKSQVPENRFYEGYKDIVMKVADAVVIHTPFMGGMVAELYLSLVHNKKIELAVQLSNGIDSFQLDYVLGPQKGPSWKSQRVAVLENFLKLTNLILKNDKDQDFLFSLPFYQPGDIEAHVAKQKELADG